MQKLRVSLLEFDYHSQIVANICRILCDPRFELRVYTTEKIWKQTLQQTNVDPQIKFSVSKTGGVGQFLKDELASINEADLIFFNTAASRFKLYSELKFSKPILVRVHNANSYFGGFLDVFDPKLSFYYLWKDLSHILRKTIFELQPLYRKRFLSKVDRFIFNSTTLEQFAIERFDLDSAFTSSLPFSFFNEHQEFTQRNQDSETIVFSIVGRVNYRIRDLSLIKEAFRNVSGKFKRKVELVFLGAPDSSKARLYLSQMQQLESANFKVRTFNKYVPQDEFDAIVDATNYFIAPMKMTTRHHIYKEVYGQTKLSGIVNDVLVYLKPVIINKAYRLSPGLSNTAIQFRNGAEFEKIISGLVNKELGFEPKFDLLKQEFALKNIRDLYYEIFTDVVTQSVNTNKLQ